MIDFTKVNLVNFSAHQVGNKLRDEGIKVSKGEIQLKNDETKTFLLKYFLSPFTGNELYNFFNPTELDLNDIYTFADRIFSAPDKLHENSINVAKHLYECSTHPKILGGELCVCYFENCILEGVKTNAVGLFKSEYKEVFLKFNPANDNFNIKHDNGININKLDKGCLIFNLDRINGFKVCVIDSNKSNDTQYWKNDFLNIKPSSDNYHFTKNFLSIAKDYVTKQLSEEFEVTKADQIDLLNRSVNYFKTHDTFKKDIFEKEVFHDPSMIKSFKSFDELYRENNDIVLSDNFEISSQALKKQARIFKSVLKLDKNFDIYIHGDKELIEKGIEKDGRKFYKIYYEKES